ncbi:MAG: hypothetical protein NTZ34_11955 [Chloroflexi bacterium]|nr:hypothetical protein [Chloroflexota bacterium]
MKINIDSSGRKILASVIAGILGNVLAFLSSMLTPLQPQVIFDFSHIATFGTAIAFGPFYGLLAGAIGSLYPYYQFAVEGVYGPWWGLAIILGKSGTGFFCGLLRGKVPPFLAVTLSFIPESLFTVGFLFLMTVVLPAGDMTSPIIASIIMEGWVEVIIFAFIIETVVRRRLMETAVLMLEIFIIMLLVHKQFIELLLVLLVVTLITVTLFEIIEPSIRKQYPKHPED